MRRSVFILITSTMWLFAACGNAPQDFSELSIADLHDRMQRGDLSSEQLVLWYLERVETIDRAGPELRSIIELNPDALQTARALDEEWRESGPRGPMHGIPVVLKANIGTADRMHTTAGSLALAAHIPPEDAFLVSQLRDAGAVILGKSNLSEWANYRSSRSSSGWSSIGGQTRNPYDLLRTPCGSSSGSAVAVAANLTVGAVGTETDGSVICPSGVNGIVGIKPTLGLISRSGIIPLAHSQDTAGPMARSVRDAAILLTAMTGRDSADVTTNDAPQTSIDYAAKLAADGLNGKRIGVIRSHFGAGRHAGVEALLALSLDTLRAQGAVIVDDLDIDMSGVDDAENVVLAHEFKADLAAYFEATGAPFNTLADIIAFNEENAASVMPLFGQERMLAAEETSGLDNDAYLQALQHSKQRTRDSLDAAFNDHELDALLGISNGPAWMIDYVNGDNFEIGSSWYAAVSGYPNVTVPAGFVAHLPVGLSFIGRTFDEKRLIEIAYAFEQASAARRPPAIATTVTE